MRAFNARGQNLHLFYCFEDYEKMSGTIPTEFGLLTTLKEINMAGNSIQGSIPTEICRLKYLEIFALDQNFIEGALPECFANLIRLEGLGLGDNLMTGKLPLGSFDNLKDLLINDNEFSGDLDISKLTFLEVLDVKGNSFSGTVDANLFGNLKNLQYVDLSDNEFSSTEFPGFFFTFPNLGVLDLSQNNIQGELPADIGLNTQLKYLAVHSNSLSGEVPYTIVNLQNLTHLNIGQNDFIGRFPIQMSRMTNLDVLYLPDLPGLDAGRMPDDFITLDKLKILSLRNTNRNYFLPAEFARMRHLEYLDISHNALTGGLPVAWGTDFLYMRVLLVNDNPNLQGDIPTTFTKLGALGQLFIQGTNLGKSTLPSLCSTMIRAKGGQSIFASCENGQIDCPCCMCCSAGDDKCGANLMGEYDANWDAEFRVGQVPSSR
jgi:Leucine-rich repeat (LRR) protein